MKKKIKTLLKFLVLLAALLVTLNAGWIWFNRHGANEPIYRTQKITRGSITNAITATGTLAPKDLVNLGTQVSGQISKLLVKPNDVVKKGELLMEIDPSLLIEALKQSRANLETTRLQYEQAARNLKRTRMLLTREYVAQVDLETAELAYVTAKNSYDSQKTQVARDEVNLAYTKILSPIDGIVLSQEAVLGQTVAASFQTPNLFRIAGDLSKMKIDVNMQESQISQIKEGMPVTFTVDALPDRQFAGVIKVINLNPNSQQGGAVSYVVNVEVDNPDKVLLPGMTAYVSITLSEKPDVLRVPAAAVRFAPPVETQSNIGISQFFKVNIGGVTTTDDTTASNYNLYLLKNGKIHPVTVTIGASDDSNVEISGDAIAEGDDVIVGVRPARK